MNINGWRVAVVWARRLRKSMKVEIAPYNHSHRGAVQDLIVAIQQEEVRLPIQLRDQPDLLDINRHYKFRNGNFWVAIVGDKIVGTIGLLDIGNCQFALRRIFVHRDYRGSGTGVGSALLETAQNWAVMVGYRSIVIGTTDRFLAAHRFYQKNGFLLIDGHALPRSFPRMVADTVFYAKML